MAEVRITGLVKRFGDVTVVRDVELTISDGEFLTLLGPSGCGKTTTLRCLAGLETPTAGEITIGGDTVYSAARGVCLPPERRRVGMVFQSYALWPHLTAGANVGYPLRAARMRAAERRARVTEMLGAVALADHAGRYPGELSGGQQQRIALARAMAAHPRLMLFDEPLSNLDAKLRVGMRTAIRRLQREIGTTAVYVTHDQEEAMALSDRVVVMSEAVIQQEGTPREVYTRPANRFVADFMGFENIFDGTVGEADGTGFSLHPSPGGPPLRVAGPPPGPSGSAVEVAVRAAHVRMVPEGAAGEEPGVRRAVVLDAVYLGGRTELTVDAEGLPITVSVSHGHSAGVPGHEDGGVRVPRTGERIAVALSAGHAVVLGRAGTSAGVGA
ncbi:ABC transporter ATP-binding protein [Sphaerisporangium sp. NPDC051011]|uniref:ABC transporter ATP-binding protein n=1 Tax=Sphaerisporangium sp. NPDC051011 TaxID=3155792 RepID=UPI0033CDD8AE